MNSRTLEPVPKPGPPSGNLHTVDIVLRDKVLKERESFKKGLIAHALLLLLGQVAALSLVTRFHVDKDALVQAVGYAIYSTPPYPLHPALQSVQSRPSCTFKKRMTTVKRCYLTFSSSTAQMQHFAHSGVWRQDPQKLTPYPQHSPKLCCQPL